MTPGVNFINVLRAAFAPVDPKSVKIYWLLDWIIMLLGPMSVNAVLERWWNWAWEWMLWKVGSRVVVTETKNSLQEKFLEASTSIFVIFNWNYIL